MQTFQNKTAHYSYDKALSTLTSQGKFHIKLGLERVSAVLNLLNNPQKDIKIIHVAGTNGKGSTCAMLASVLTQAGYKTGLYTSPHLIEYTERIKLNGHDISKDDFAELVISTVQLADSNNIHLTEFEILTITAFLYFKREKADFVVLETGLGGRLDATNIVETPILTILTNIDLDHIDRLGNTIEKITYEKAGIIKHHVPVVTLNDNNGLDIVKETAIKKESPLFLADISTPEAEDQRITDKYDISLLGLWQRNNLSLVLKSIEVLSHNGIFISENSVKSGLKKTAWPCRFQYLKDKNIVIDGAHNLSAAKLLRSSLEFYFPDKDYIWIYGSLNTKDYESIVKVLFRAEDTVICTKSSSPSSVDPEIIRKKILKYGVTDKIHSIRDITEAIQLSCLFMKNSNKPDNFIIVVTGSFYIAGEALNILINN